MHSFGRFLLHASYKLGPILNAENKVVSKTVKVSAPKELSGKHIMAQGSNYRLW